MMKKEVIELKKKLKVAKAMLGMKKYCEENSCDKCQSATAEQMGYKNIQYFCNIRTRDMKQKGVVPSDFKIEEKDVQRLENLYFEEVKKNLFLLGYDAISDFVGYDYPQNEEKDVTEKRIDEAYEQMPYDTFEMFCRVYNF